jgi:hypothetical protein
VNDTGPGSRIEGILSLIVQYVGENLVVGFPDAADTGALPGFFSVDGLYLIPGASDSQMIPRSASVDD